MDLIDFRQKRYGSDYAGIQQSVQLILNLNYQTTTRPTLPIYSTKNTQTKEFLKPKDLAKHRKSKRKPRHDTDKPEQWMPEFELLQAIIERAVFDFMGIWPTSKGMQDKSAMRNAKIWLFSDETREWGFRWCIEHLSDHPEILIKKIRKELTKWKKQQNN